MTTVSGSFTAVGASATLFVPEKGDVVSISISGTYDQDIVFQRAITADETAWETLYSWSTANATISQVFSTKNVQEKFRLLVTAVGGTPGTAVFSFEDGDKVLFELKNNRGRVLATVKESGIELPNALTVTGALDVTALDASAALKTSANVGTTPGTVTAVEYGDGYNHVTVLTVTAAVLVPDIPADAEEVGALIYTFPAGVHQVHSVHMDVTAVTEGANSNAVDIGCGSTLAAGDGATLQAATDEDFLDGQTIADSSSPAIEKSLAADGTVFEASDSKLFHINLAGTWTATEGDPDITATVTIRWSYLGA